MKSARYAIATVTAASLLAVSGPQTRTGPRGLSQAMPAPASEVSVSGDRAEVFRRSRRSR